jgi:hypothetical protein
LGGTLTPDILILPMALMGILSIVPFIFGQMLKAGCTVNYTKRIAMSLLIVISIMFVVSLLSLTLDLVYFFKVEDF